MRYLILTNLLLVCFQALPQSPEDIARLVGNRYIQQSQLELVEKPLDHIQEEILVMNPTRVDALQIETIVTVNELGSRFIHIAANPGRLIVRQDFDIVFDGRSTTVGVPQSLGDGKYRSEAAHHLPPFPGDYPIQIEYYPQGEETTLFIWVSDDDGKVMHDRDFRCDQDFMEPYPYRFKSKTADFEDWSFPTTTQVALQFESENGRNDWNVGTGVMLDAMWRVSEYFSTLDFKPFVKQHLDFFINSMDQVNQAQQEQGVLQVPFKKYYRYRHLEDFAAQSVPFLYVQESQKHKQVASKALNKMLYKAIRLSDGAFARVEPDSLSLWAEDLFMSNLLLLRAYEQRQRPNYIQEAIKQTIIYDRRLKDLKTRVYTHGYFNDNSEQSAVRWAKANGWMMLSTVELLKLIPENHPDRESILRIYRLHAASLREMQSREGRWHQVIDNDTTYLETSATAMFVTAFAEGVTNNWLFNRAEFRQAAISGWLAVINQMDEEGNVNGISPDAPILNSVDEYENLVPIINHPSGLGVLLYASIAMDRLAKSE